MVVADDVYRATDGASVVDVRYDVLPAAVTVDAALAPGAPRVFDEWPDNAAGPSDGAVGDIVRGFAEAQVVVEARLDVPRVGAMPIEPRGVLIQPEAPDGRLTVGRRPRCRSLCARRSLQPWASRKSRYGSSRRTSAAASAPRGTCIPRTCCWRRWRDGSGGR